MKKIIAVLCFCFVILIGSVYASENVIIKDAPDYEIYCTNGKVAVLTHINPIKEVSNDLIEKNGLVSRYQIFLPLYVQISTDKEISRANLVKNNQNSSTEKELKVVNLGNSYETSIEQVVGIPAGVGMTAETIYQFQKVYKYEIDWMVRGIVQEITNLDVVVVRKEEAEEYDNIYRSMINKNYEDIYTTIMSMPSNVLSVVENYIAAKYGAEWDIDTKLVQEMRELNIAKISFSDLSNTHWAYNVIKNMTVKGILNGYEDGTFRPESNITRAEAAQILSKAFNMSEDNKDEMKDITTDHWAYNAVKKASLYIPMKNNNFEPEANITRKDFIIAIMNIRGNNTIKRENIFSDLAGLSEEEASKINLAYAFNIANGYEDGTFRPNEPLTRAEACAILSRAK